MDFQCLVAVNQYGGTPYPVPRTPLDFVVQKRPEPSQRHDLGQYLIVLGAECGMEYPVRNDTQVNFV